MSETTLIMSNWQQHNNYNTTSSSSAAVNNYQSGSESEIDSEWHPLLQSRKSARCGCDCLRGLEALAPAIFCLVTMLFIFVIHKISQCCSA